MTITLSKGYRALVAEAEAKVEALPPEQVAKRRDHDGVMLIDLRDIRELQREGRIPGSLHVPRGMLEFWIDPESPYYRQEFADAEELILYCNKGWRSALAASTLKTMGVERVAHLAGGMEAWLEARLPVEPLPERKR